MYPSLILAGQKNKLWYILDIKKNASSQFLFRNQTWFVSRSCMTHVNVHAYIHIHTYVHEITHIRFLKLVLCFNVFCGVHIEKLHPTFHLPYEFLNIYLIITTVHIWMYLLSTAHAVHVHAHFLSYTHTHSVSPQKCLFWAKGVRT